MFSFLNRSENEKGNETKNIDESSDSMANEDQIEDLARQIEELKTQLSNATRHNNGSSSSSQDANAIGAVSEVKLVPFYENDPDLWFKIIEAQFEARKITSDRSRYFHVVAHLSSTVAQQVKDVISSAYTDGKFEELKKSLIAIYAETATEKFEKLISNEPLGDMKPSLALHKIKALATNTVTDDFVKKLWLKRLPPTIKTVLSASNDTLENLQKMADSMWEVSDKSSISSITKGNSTLEKTLSSIQQQLEKMSQRLIAIESKNRTTRRDSTPHRDRNRSKSNARRGENEKDNNDSMCWYHRKLGSSARKCRSPCAFKDDNQKN